MRYLIPLLLLAACSGADTGDSAGHSGHDAIADGLSTEVTEGRTTARVTYVDPDGTFITLDHDNVPGVMGPMRMGFDVADGVDVSELEVGDAILFDMEMSEARGVVMVAWCMPVRDGEDCLG